MPDSPSPAPEVTGDDITRLDDRRFVALCNDLLGAERGSIGLPARATEVTGNIRAADGGIDARSNFVTGTTFVDAGETVWQFKAEDAGPTKLSEEISERADTTALLTALRSRARYVLCSNRDWTSRQVRDREKALRDAATARGIRLVIEVRNATRMADWVNHFPGVVAKHFDLFPTEFELAVNRLALPQHLGPFRADPQRDELVHEIDEQFRTPDGRRHIRIEGAAGIGKSRLALEAATRWPEQALYAKTPPPTSAFARHLAAAGKSAILVLDECDAATAQEWEEQLSLASGRVRLITVDIVDGPPATGVHALTALREKELMEVARDAAPSLDDRQVEWIAKLCEGFVKLAGPFARLLESSGSHSAATLIETGDMQDLLERLIADPVQRRAMTGLALFVRVGFEGDLRHEAQAVARYLNLPWPTFFDAVEKMLGADLLARRGRYLYVTPGLLAIWLAASELRRNGFDILQVVAEPGAPPIDRFWARIGQLEGNREAERLAREVLANGAPFSEMRQLDSEGASQLFRELAKIAPREGAQRLRSLVSETPIDELKAMTSGRRNLVWALEDLAVREQTFRDAVLTLLRLSVAENEHYGNNASGVFNSLFLTYLARTVVPALERLQLLASIVESGDEAEATIAVHALQSALQTSETGTPIGTADGGSAPLENWRPRTRAEEIAVRESALAILQDALGASLGSVKRAAAKSLIDSLRSLVRLGFSEKARLLVERLDKETEPEMEQDLVRCVRHILRYDLRGYDAPEREAWATLANDMLFGTLHRSLLTVVREWEGLETAGADSVPSIEELAARAVADADLFNAELPWLCSPQEIGNIVPFGRALGAHDSSERLLEPIRYATIQYGDSRLLALYLDGRQMSPAEIDSLFDAWGADPGMGRVYPTLLLRFAGLVPVWPRLQSLLSQSAEAQEVLDFGLVQALGRSLSVAECAELVASLLARETAASLQNALQILAGRPGDLTSDPLQRLAWQCLALPEGAGDNTMGAHWWEQIARVLRAFDPERVLRATVATAQRQRVTFSHTAAATLLADLMATITPETLEWVMRLLDEDPLFAMSFTWWFHEDRVLDRIPLTTLQSWADGDSGRLERLADLAKPADDLTPTIRWLIEETGPESLAARRMRGTMRTGVFSGSESTREREFAERFLRWSQTEQAASIRQWAAEGLRDTEEHLPAIETREAEELW